MKVTASDADDPTYGNSARVVYSVLDGEKFFTVDRHTGKKMLLKCATVFFFENVPVLFLLMTVYFLKFRIHNFQYQ